MANPTVKQALEQISETNAKVDKLADSLGGFAETVTKQFQALQAGSAETKKNRTQPERGPVQLLPPEPDEVFRVGSIGVAWCENREFTYRNSVSTFTGIEIRDLRVMRGKGCKPILINFNTSSVEHWAHLDTSFAAQLQALIAAKLKEMNK